MEKQRIKVFLVYDAVSTISVPANWSEDQIEDYLSQMSAEDFVPDEQPALDTYDWEYC